MPNHQAAGHEAVESKMAFAIWLRALSARIWSNPRCDTGLFLDENRFRFELARERMRTDRNGSPLAILTIELSPERSTPADFDMLGRLLLRRLRITDTVGFLADGSVGVLLPDTSKAGGWKVASDICNVYPVGHDRPNCDVLVYPEEPSTRRDLPTHTTHEDNEPTESKPMSVDSMLAQPNPLWKRSIDVAGAIVGLLLSLPLLIFAAIAIKLTSRGPVFYSQLREGLGGRHFHIRKLRTMRLDADLHKPALLEFSEQDGPAFKMSDDPRTTWVGRWLRMISADEIPQFWNVLLGDMSLVGPRPLPIGESLQCLPWQRQRLSVLPGMTCIWQVAGRNTVTFDHWMRMDLQYVRRRSFLYDLSLLASTVPSLVISRGPR
jgi:lipopolysaccharide/colanic/teichoic acid biosynthesis glycosyltransferase